MTCPPRRRTWGEYRHVEILPVARVDRARIILWVGYHLEEVWVIKILVLFSRVRESFIWLPCSNERNESISA